jgi:hypothetical protein
MTATVQRAVTAVTFKPKRSIAEINTAPDRFAELEPIFTTNGVNDAVNFVSGARIHLSIQQRRFY